MFRPDLLSIIRSLNTVFTAVGYRYKQYIDKNNSINGFIKVYFLHVSALVMRGGARGGAVG